MNLKELIGKDIQIKVRDSVHKFSWQEWLNLSYDFLQVDVNYRTNPLSFTDGRYYLITGQETMPRYKAYNNIHNWKSYIESMFRNHKEQIFKYDFIYIWDIENKILIDAFVKTSNDQADVHDDFKPFFSIL